MIRALLIAGPTASGKSALAISVAKATGGVIVNADSMQVYRDLRIITARPTLQEERAAPHRMYGHVDAAVNYSAGHWVVDAEKTLWDLEAAGRLPIFVGGTGLYFAALTLGLSNMPQVPLEVRAKVRDEAEGVATPELHARLDPQMAAKLRPSDRQRIIRALEVFEGTGRSLAEWQQRPRKIVLKPKETASVFLAVERRELHARINARFDKMLEEGALEEVRALAARHLDQALPAMKAHGVPWLLKHLRGGISLEQAAERGKGDTRKYARRQETWFRHQMPEFKWMQAGEALSYLSAQVK
jgi:tRNA dimethylallyltransferase